MSSLEAILENWKLNIPYSICKVTDNIWIINDKFVLKTGRNIEGLKNDINTSKALSTDNVTVSLPFKTVTNEDYITLENTFYYMSHKLSGSHITDLFVGDYFVTAYNLGLVIGNLHLSLNNVEDKIACLDYDMYADLTGAISSSINKHSTYKVSESAIKECLEKFKELYYKLPRQIIHRDMHCKNILFENGKLSGCIDFDKTQKNARIFDVCHMARSILIDYRDDIESRSNWSKFFGAILSGYISLHKLTHEEKQILPYMLCCIELLFIAYFLDIKHSEYCQVSVEMFNWLYANKDEFYNQYQVNSLQLIEGGASWVVSPSGDKFTKLTR